MINNGVVELPDAIILCARQGFGKVEELIDPQRGVLGVVRDGATPWAGRDFLRHTELVSDCGPELACRKVKCLDGCSLEQLVWVFAVGRGEKAFLVFSCCC